MKSVINFNPNLSLGDRIKVYTRLLMNYLHTKGEDIKELSKNQLLERVAYYAKLANDNAAFNLLKLERDDRLIKGLS